MRKPIPQPIAGLHVDTAISEQPERTTRLCSNVWPIDPTNGRRRIAVRAGLGDALGGNTLNGGDPVRAMISLAKASKRTTFAEQDPTTEWEFTGDAGDSARGVKHDAVGNTYWLAARDQVVMRNPAGKVIWKLSLPVDDPSQIVRAFDVSDEGLIFCGISEGSDQERTHLWCYVQIQNDQAPQQLWEITDVGFVQQVKYHQGRLYTIQDFPAEAISTLTIYRGAATATPVVDSLNPQVAYPTNGLDVGPDGAAYVASQQNLKRAFDPRYPELSPRREDWTLGDLDRFQERIWCHYSAETPSLLTSFDDGDEVFQIEDLSGNGRHLNVQANQAGAQYIAHAVGDKPGLRFDPAYVGANGTGSAFESYPNLNSNTNVDRIRTMLPSYAGARWAAFILLRRTDPSSTGEEVIFDQDLGTNGSDRHLLRGNWDEGNVQTDGFLTWTTDASPVVNQKDAPYEEFVLATLLYNTDGVGTSLYRVNGTPWSRFTGTGSQGTVTEQTLFGYRSGQLPTLKADLLEVVVLRDYADASGNTQIGTFPSYPDASWSATSDTEIERVEGWLAWKWGCQHFLDDGTQTGLDVSGATAQPWPHPFHLRKRFLFQDVAVTPGGTGSLLTKTGAFADYEQTQVSSKFDTIEIYGGTVARNTYQILTKHSDDQIELIASLGTGTASGAFLGFSAFDVQMNTGGPPTETRPTSSTTAYWRNNISFPGLWEKWDGGKLVLNQSRTGGVGYGIMVRHLDSDDDGEPDTTHVWSLGPHYLNSTAYLRRYVDNGSTVTPSAALGSLVGQPVNPDYPYPRMDADKFGTVYFPFHDPDTGWSGGNASVGWTVLDFSTGLNIHLLPDGQSGYAVSIDPQIPEYHEDPVALVEYLYVATSNGGDETVETQHRLQMVSRTLDPGAAPRERIDLGIAGGDVLRFETGSPVTVPGGTGALVADSPWTTLMDFFGEVFIIDGKGNYVFNKDEEVEPWVATSAGEVPRACKLGMVWNGRIWLARSEDDPYLWAASAKDNARDWNYDPAVAISTQAVFGPLSPIGRTPHLPTALIPWTDATRDERVGSIAVIGCDHAIWVMEGDPTQGTMYLKSQTMGIAYGVKPWAVSPRNVLYFVNDDGQFCIWHIGGQPEPISEGRVDQRFREIDLGTYMPFLVYDRRARGVHVFLTPYAATHAVTVDHYFFCEESHGIKEIGVGRVGAFGSFWPTSFGTAGIQPICAMVRDGDEAGDRDLLLGCSDGSIRIMSGDYGDDDGTAIQSDVVIGPLVEREAPEQAMFTAYQVELADGQFGCSASVYAHQRAQETMGQAVRSFALDPGMNDPVHQPARGSYCYLRLRGSVRWALEGVSVDVEAGGMKRNRRA